MAEAIKPEDPDTSDLASLDVSNPDQPSFMWMIDENSTGFAELGQTWSLPTVMSPPGFKTSAGVRKPALVIGSGIAGLTAALSMEGAAVITRAQQLRSFGVPMPAAAFDFRPRRL